MKILMLIAFIISGCTSVAAKPREIILTDDNTATISEVINDISLRKDLAEILVKRSMLPKEKTLYIVVISNGGSTYDAAILYNAIYKLPNVEILCRWCASAAAALFADSPFKRLVYKKSRILMHHMYVIPFTVVQASSPRFLRDFKQASDEFDAIFWKIMKIPEETYERKIEKDPWIMNGREMIRYHLADEFVTLRCDEEIQDIYGDLCTP